MDSVLCCYCIHQDYEVTTEAHTRTAGLDFFGTPTLVIEKDRKKKKERPTCAPQLLHHSFPFMVLGAWSIQYNIFTGKTIYLVQSSRRTLICHHLQWQITVLYVRSFVINMWLPCL